MTIHRAALHLVVVDEARVGPCTTTTTPFGGSTTTTVVVVVVAMHVSTSTAMGLEVVGTSPPSSLKNDLLPCGVSTPIAASWWAVGGAAGGEVAAGRGGGRGGGG
nr:unnamed protein product [Digitaria exilis]